jgi:hypothetical protein
MGSIAPGTAVETARCGQDRFLSCDCRLVVCPSGAWEKIVPTPTDRCKADSNHHVLTDANGIPLPRILTEANRHDVTQLLPLLDTIPPIGGKRGGPKRKPAVIQADRGYDSEPLRCQLACEGIDTDIGR